MTLVFKCSSCSQALRAQPASAGKLCKCTKCGTLVRIPAALSKPAVQAKPVPSGPPRNPLLEELNSLASVKRPVYPPAPSQSPAAASSAAFGDMPPRPKKNRKRRKSSSGGFSSVITVLLAVFGTLGVLCCGGLGTAAFLLGPKTIVLESGGFRAVAKGNRTQQRNEANGQTQGTMHPVTGSEFWIGAVNMPMGNNANVDDVRRYFDSFSTSTRIIQRGSMNGVHCQGVDTGELGVLGGVTAELEVFLIGEKLLYTAYIPGSSKAEARGELPRKTVSREASWDNPEAFFSSIEPITK